MFHGQEQTLTLQLENRLAGVMIDRFGKDVPLHPAGDVFTARIQVVVSSQFFVYRRGNI